MGLRTFACGGAGLLGFVVLLLLVAEQDSRYVEDKSDQIQVRIQIVYVCIGVRGTIAGLFGESNRIVVRKLSSYHAIFQRKTSPVVVQQRRCARFSLSVEHCAVVLYQAS